MKKLILIGVIFCSSISFAQISVIINKNSTIDKATIHELYSIFSCMKKYWDDGEKINVLVPKDKPQIRIQFFKKIASNPEVFKKKWVKAKLMGSGKPPRKVNQSEILKLVASDLNSIAFIESKLLTEDVKELCRFN